MHFLLQQGWLRNLPLDDRKLLLAAGLRLLRAGAQGGTIFLGVKEHLADDIWLFYNSESLLGKFWLVVPVGQELPLKEQDLNRSINHM